MMKGINKSTVVAFLCLAIVVALLVIGCTPEKKQYRVLSFFFDGVPDPSKTTTVVSNDSTQAGVTASIQVKPEFNYHKPYAEEKCKSCHAEGFSNALIKPQP